MFKFIPVKSEIKIPAYKLTLKWEHGDADSTSYTTETFEKEDEFIQYLTFYTRLEDNSYQQCNDQEVYPGIVKEFFGEDAERGEVLEGDNHFDGWARVDGVEVEIQGIKQKYINLERATSIDLPKIGSFEARSTWNTNKIDNYKWFPIPKDVDHFRYLEDNTVTFEAEVVSIEVKGIYPKEVYYKIVGSVREGQYKGELCHWTVKGYDPNFEL